MSVGTFGAEEIVLNLLRGKRILDIGCGKGKYGYLSKIYLENFYHIVPEIIGIDISIKILKDVQIIYNHTICCDSRKLPFKDSSFDTVIAAEVIEHLPKKDGLSLIKECERVSKNMVIITTPSPRVFRYSFEHIALWKPSDFKRLGYNVIGVRRHPKVSSNNLIKLILISFILHPLSVWFPSLATFTVAVKHVAKNNNIKEFHG